MGPFLATFLVNTAIIVGIYRARRLQSQFLSTPRVRFLTNPNCSAEEKSAGALKVEREVALVEHLARSERDEILKPFSEPPVPLREHLIKDDAISKRKVHRNKTSTNKNTFNICTKIIF